MNSRDQYRFAEQLLKEVRSISHSLDRIATAHERSTLPEPGGPILPVPEPATILTHSGPVKRAAPDDAG